MKTRHGAVVGLARDMRDLVRSRADDSERLRTLSPHIVDEMWASGLMSAFNPIPAGGAEPSFTEMIETWIEMAWQDGSFGWIGIANFPSSFAAACYLPDEGFAEVFTAHDHRVTMGGQFFPNGQGAAVSGGYRLSGSWSFGSGTGHSQYVAAGFLPMDAGEIRWAGDGVPDMQVAVLPRDEVTFTDGWHVQGLKGTGSYDYRVDDVFVPAERTFPLFARRPLRGDSPAARMGLMPVTAAGHAAWALGVAKSMLDDVSDLAATKFRMSDMASLASRPTFQKGLAHHTAAWRAARLLVLDAFTTAESAVAAGADLTPALRADMRVAAVYATDTARACAEWAHLVAGTDAIREGSRLERAFRDIYTGTQHAFISEKVAIDAAQIWLGIIEDQPGL
ncbi:acyl-CoA dehydrogenase family protein [Mycolicibacterium monacense]|uniref:Acyl-CoA dehydrogenase n=4 Tax=Mycobacteriaceae TaxID=1762 RepID=A0AAD1MZJ0_MYCMB|nr:acyl-CoA dehydrogenase family protein [Mycolicibacterium monacense]MDA4103305.1 acyl-CoA dehydrogenase [Mycolicibacterium monacense DSM 44395]OBF56216.1 acyl-CoA dehydrogenase [Mycolicibacterium monacense]ORB21170.1 acyl-CoA dehydrogenase [Mycolicibacterium monacense DSM 44395]QHP88898.1 acyl-CoA dehydrogenase [Mycolicibacterium monacense DSM 44395]BBZ63638.1 acyl-CoA dehydrogenase [Mycolicibacterium monacense]